MKRLILLPILLFSLNACSQANLSGIPGGYIQKHENFDKNRMGSYTDYCYYTYPNKEFFMHNEKYKQIETQEEIDNIKAYFENFKDYMIADGKIKDYNFDQTIIAKGDYIKVITKEGQTKNGKKYQRFDDYTVYFFDVETYTLYYIHGNI